jgi:hypothetical protein
VIPQIASVTAQTPNAQKRKKEKKEAAPFLTSGDKWGGA